MRQVRDHCLAPARTGGARLAGGRCMRLSPELPALAPGRSERRRWPPRRSASRPWADDPLC